MLKKVRYFIEWVLVSSSLWYLDRLAFSKASDTGGKFFRRMGPYLKRTAVARNNLRRAMPELDDRQVEKVVGDMWENLGRVFAEFPHVGRMEREQLNEILEVEGLQHLDTLRQLDKGSIFFSGHIANWEFSCKALAANDFPLQLVYRKGNNPRLDRIIQGSRSMYQTVAIPKGKDGARLLLQAIKERRHVGVLIDQKMNDGIPVPFFDRDAMTSPAIARLALKFDCPIVPAHVVRKDRHLQKFIISPPLAVEKTGDQEADVMLIMTKINSILEDWIRENPSQWIWIHNRWPREKTD